MIPSLVVARVSATVAIAVGLASFSVASSSAGQASCAREVHAKASLWKGAELAPGSVLAEVREAGTFMTRGGNDCFGDGLYMQRHHNHWTYSYCHNSGVIPGQTIRGCIWNLAGSYWYAHEGTNRYSELAYTNSGDYAWVNGASQGELTVDAAATVRYDGSFRKKCSFSGTLPAGSHFRCGGSMQELPSWTPEW